MFNVLFFVIVFAISTFIYNSKYVLPFTFVCIFAFVNSFLHVYTCYMFCIRVVPLFYNLLVFLPVYMSFFLICYSDLYLVFTCFVLVLPFEPFTRSLDILHVFLFCLRFYIFGILIWFTRFYVVTGVCLLTCFIFYILHA